MTRSLWLVVNSASGSTKAAASPELPDLAEIAAAAVGIRALPGGK